MGRDAQRSADEEAQRSQQGVDAASAGGPMTAMQSGLPNSSIVQLLSMAAVRRDADGDAGSGSIDPAIGSGIESAMRGGQSLPNDVMTEMEGFFGEDLDGVRVHTDGAADSLSRSLEAHAFTTGSDIFFRSGKYEPETTDGRRLLAHEVTHTLQQAPAIDGTVVPADDATEIEAENVAEDFVSQSYPSDLRASQGGTGERPASKGVVANRRPAAAPAKQARPVVRRFAPPKKGAKGKPKRSDAAWSDLADRFVQGADPDDGLPQVVGQIAQKEFDALSLDSMLQCASKLDETIEWAEEAAPTGARSIETWLYSARSRREMLQKSIDKRTSVADRPDIFWLVIDDAMSRLGGDHAAVLARVTPVLWKSVNGEALSTGDRIRIGYLTPGRVEASVGPDTKRFGDENIVKILINAEHELTTSFILSNSDDRPTDAGRRLAATVRSIHERFDEGLEEIFRQTVETVYEGAKALRASLADQAKLRPDSILSVMAIENRTAAEASHQEVQGAIQEIGIRSGVTTGSKDLLEAEWKGKYYAVQILSTREDGFHYVHYVSYSDDHDEWISPSRLRTRSELRAGDQAWVNWEGASYPAKILEVGEGEHAGQMRVHWLGFGPTSDDSWINASNFQGRG